MEFKPPHGRVAVGARCWLNAVYFAGLGAWSVLGSWHGHRLVSVAAALVYLELCLAMFRLTNFVGGVVYDEEIASRISTALVELCAKAGCAIPRVTIRDDAVRAVGVRAPRGAVQLVISAPFVARVDDRQLRAILAHEVIHITRRDLRMAKARAWLCIALGVGAGTAFAAAGGAGFAVPIYLAAFVVVSLLAQTVLAFLNRPAETRADREGAVLAGDPTGLASSLGAAYAFTEETRTRLYGPLPWRWLLSPLSWRMPTHPPLHRRIARLDEMAKTGAH